ncbi:MAG: metallophosphoesterase [Alphaproteobacteria bacterium]|nr:metallophosphoesterase [Alphaproteobacteria bacterium]
MRLLATSDLHVNHTGNAQAVKDLAAHPDDWLLVVGDVADRLEHVAWALDQLRQRFAKVIWVPGNHELWSVGPDADRGLLRYARLVDLARRLDVHTPEDGWIRWPGEGPPRAIVPMFLLYDYTFVPDDVGPDGAVAWAAADGIRATDEVLLHPDPFPSRQAWCAERVARTEALLATVPPDHRTVLVNHWTLRHDLVRLYSVPRYAPWCGTTATEDWHVRHRAEVVVSGHLHMRATDWRDGVRFEEVSLGYPRHWHGERGLASYLRTILPGPDAPGPHHGGPIWHR